ncbi:hypothetical protein GC177_04980 [bacterium]|nr:hypothetical protein [bacterium]
MATKKPATGKKTTSKKSAKPSAAKKPAKATPSKKSVTKPAASKTAKTKTAVKTVKPKPAAPKAKKPKAIIPPVTIPVPSISKPVHVTPAAEPAPRWTPPLASSPIPAVRAPVVKAVEEGISYLDIVQESYSHVFQQFHRAIRPLAFYFICSLILFFIGDGRLQAIPTQLTALDGLLLLGYIFMGFVVNIHWKRWLLCGDERLFHGTTYMRVLGAALWWFFWTLLIDIVISVVIVGLTIPVLVVWAHSHNWMRDEVTAASTAISGPITLIILAISSVWLIRTLLLLTSVTVGDSWSIKRIWRMTKGHYWRILLSALVVYAPLLIVGILFTAMFMAALKTAEPLHMLLLVICTSLIQGTLAFIGIGYAAILYRELKKEYERKTA